MGTIFSNYDIRGRLDDSLTVEQVWNVGKAFAEWLQQPGVVAVMADPAAVPAAVKAVIEGLRLQGRTVVTLSEGDSVALVQQLGGSDLAGGIYVGYDAHEQFTVLELYSETGQRIEAEAGLGDIVELAESAAFVPSGVKGELRESA